MQYSVLIVLIQTECYSAILKPFLSLIEGHITTTLTQLREPVVWCDLASKLAIRKSFSYKFYMTVKLITGPNVFFYLGVNMSFSWLRLGFTTVECVWGSTTGTVVFLYLRFRHLKLNFCLVSGHLTISPCSRKKIKRNI